MRSAMSLVRAAFSLSRLERALPPYSQRPGGLGYGKVERLDHFPADDAADMWGMFHRHGFEFSFH